MTIDVEAVRAAAGSTRDPEIRRSLAEMGLLDDVQIEGGQVTVHFHLTSPLCPSKFATNIGQEILQARGSCAGSRVVQGSAARSFPAREDSGAD